MGKQDTSAEPSKGPKLSVMVPDDYPDDPYPSGLGGAQPKFSARLIDGRYVVGVTDAERAER